MASEKKSADVLKPRQHSTALLDTRDSRGKSKS